MCLGSPFLKCFSQMGNFLCFNRMGLIFVLWKKCFGEEGRKRKQDRKAKKSSDY
jgi:hypothetical protein